MSTAPISKKEFNEILDRAELSNSSVLLDDCYAATFLNSVWEATHAIWENVDQKNYTRHGLDHSYRIIGYFFALDGLYDWTPYERMLFIAAALLHDIGMQVNIWGPSVKGWKSPEKGFSTDSVRRNHCRNGFKLISQFVRGKVELKFPPPFCERRTGYLTPLHRAAHIAFAHSGEEYLGYLAKDDQWRACKLQAENYRPRLLAGALRICDELDLCCSRIAYPEQIWGWNFSDESRRHWLACYFVEACEVKIHEKKLASMELRWRTPIASKSALVKNISTLISKLRVFKLNQEIQRVNSFLKQCNEAEYCLMSDVKMSKQPVDFAISGGVSLSKIGEVLRTASGRPSSDTRTGKSLVPAEAAVPPQSPSSVSENIQLIRPFSGPLKSTLRKWFDENKVPHHYALRNGEHTDTYVHCRSLVSNQELLRNLADTISMQHRHRGITAVLGVGTSAIPLAVNVAYRLNCCVSFTFLATSPGYHETELEVAFGRKHKLLMIDDIISSGRAASRILDRLRDRDGLPQEIYHHSIFRLGRQRYTDPERRIRSYSWFVHIPEVYYAPGERECSLCRAGTELIKESV